MKLTRHNGRTGKNGVYNPKHNDRQFNIDNSDHIDLERAKRNVYWDCYNGIRSASVTGKEDEIVDSFEEVEQLFYKIHYQDYVEGQNARNLKNHHPERNRTTDDIRTHKKTCPEETIYQIGTKDDYVDPDVLLIIVTEFITELSDRFGEHFHLLNWSLHLDESTPHIHERHVFDCKNAYGEIFPQQEKALETLGFELPNPEKKAGRFNNRKMVFDATCRILLFDICKKHGLELEEEPSYGGREYLEKQDYIRIKQKKDIASLEESIQSQIEVVNQKKYEIFEQEVQYKENSIKIIDQEKKLKAQSVEFFENAERILQQDETLKQLEFKIEDVEKLIDDVTDWIIEMSEMIAAISAKSNEEIKSFLSRQKDTYRTAYARFEKDRKRQCVFAGSTNTYQFIPFDRTGARRFLPIMIDASKAEKHILDDEEEARAYFNQLWAEAMIIYHSEENKGNLLKFTKEMQKEIDEYRKQFMQEDTLAGTIQGWLDNYKGNYVCSIQIWSEAFNHGDREPKKYETNEICQIMDTQIIGWKRGGYHRFTSEGYGRQRCWTRKSEEIEGGNEIGGDGFRELSATEQMELPFH